MQPSLSQDPHVRMATPGDAEALATLAAETFPMACPPGTAPEDIAGFIEANLRAHHFAEHIASPRRAVIVYDRDGSLDGYVLLFDASEVRPEPGDGVRATPSVFMSKFYVRQTSHGGAVAGPLMEAARAVARRQMGGASIWLNTNVANERAARFYGKHGFERVGGKRFTVGEALMEDDVFELLLPGAEA